VDQIVQVLGSLLVLTAFVAAQRTSLTEIEIATSASSAGVEGFPANTESVSAPLIFAAAPLASGVPTVSTLERSLGGLHDAKARGGPWVRFGDVQAM